MAVMARPKVEVVNLEDLVDDSANANKGTERGFAMLAKSVEEFGAGRSMVVDKAGRLVAGNKTREALINAGLREAVVIETDGQTPIVVKRKDWDLSSGGAARRYAYFDNRVGEVDLAWDVDQLKADLDEGVDFNALFGDKELEFMFAKAEIEFPDEEPMGEPEYDGRLLIEIRCEPRAEDAVKKLLMEMKNIGGCEINIQG